MKRCFLKKLQKNVSCFHIYFVAGQSWPRGRKEPSSPSQTNGIKSIPSLYESQACAGFTARKSGTRNWIKIWLTTWQLQWLMHFCVYLSLPPLNIKQEYFFKQHSFCPIWTSPGNHFHLRTIIVVVVVVGGGGGCRVRDWLWSCKFQSFFYMRQSRFWLELDTLGLDLYFLSDKSVSFFWHFDS